jgi:GDPmannose 4,6-dehydratase
MKRALVTGVTGQDGSYLAELLLSKGYEVHGIMRRSSSFNTGRVDHIFDHPSFKLHFADLTDGGSLERVLHDVLPDEIYNLGAQSHVRVSFDIPEYTCDTVGMGALRLLEGVRRCCPEARVYQASSSEMFGASPPPQNESTPFYPRSPYGCAKVFAFNVARNYREGYGMHVSNGILYNHESERRGETFVTRKITKAVARIRAGTQDKLYLGNLKASRDWGYAPEYMEAAWRMLQQDQPDDYVVATGEAHSVREFVEAAFARAGLDWKKHVEIDPRYYRPTEVDALCGDASKARRVLGWEPKTTFAELVRIMVDAEVTTKARVAA